MKRRILLLFTFILFYGQSIIAQVDLYSTANPTIVTFTTLKGAFDAINAGTRTGTIFIDITGNTTETASAVLNASGSGSASYTSLLIVPTGGGARTISGSLGTVMIDLNGADNVTINGLNTGGNSLTISNASTSSGGSTSTIRFVSDASTNTITNCSILGSATMSSGTNGGTIFFSTATTTGNDNNTVSFCNIGPAGANSPSMGVFCGGTNTAGLTNTGNVFDNNNFFDIFLSGNTSTMFESRTGSSDSTITNNKFYQTTPKVFTAGTTHCVMFIQNTALGENFTITGNTIGYANSSGTGFYELSGSSPKFWAIHTNLSTSGIGSTISNNTIANISLTGVSSTGTGITGSPFVAIGIRAGQVTTNNNTIGSQTGTGSLVFSSTGSADTDLYGFFNSSVSNWIVNNNTIGGITVTNTTATNTRFYFYALSANNGTANSCSAANNIIGGTVANSIQSNSTSTITQVTGMHTNNAAMIASSNTIRNITVNGGTGSSATASAAGILINQVGSTLAHQLSRNTIYNISNTNTTITSQVNGIYFNGNNSLLNSVDSNFIYNLNSASTNAAATLNGILSNNGITNFSNNMIDIGIGVNAAITVSGISELNNGTNNFWHNSIYIGGSPTSGTGSSYAFNSIRTTATRSFRNNIFWNARNNSGATGKNYIVRVGGTASNPAGLTINNNVYYAAGSGSVFGFFNSLDVASLTAWRTAVGQDAESFNEEPQYLDPTNTTTPDLHIQPSSCRNVVYTGVPVGITVDYDNAARSVTIPAIGADEVTNDSTIWRTAWSNSAPTITRAALIVGNYDSTSLASIDACSLSISNAATVTITANKYVNIQTDLTLRTGTTLDVLHQGSLVMIDDTGVVTNNGTMRAYKTTQPYELYDYTYWSSPMTNCTIASALGAWRNNYTFAFEPANYIDANLDGFDDSLDAWVLAPQATTMSAGKGYIAMAPTTGTFPTTRSVTFTGTVNNGVVTTPIALSGDAGRTDEDFNLIGNPYPSAVFADDFINTNTNLSGTLYFWTHIEDIDINTINPGPQLYNFRPDDYATYNLTGGTAASVNGGLIPTGYIASGQGFFVEAITAGNVTFNNAMRNATHINTNFYRNTTKNRIWLSIQNEVGMFSQQLLGYLPGTSLGFDRAYDGLRNKAQTFVHFYSLLDNEEYKIQSRGDFNSSDVVPLGYQSEYAGQFKIKIDRTEGVFNTSNVYLEDRLLNVIHDLRQSDYTFTTAVGKFNNRFVLRYNNQILGNTDFESIQNSVSVFASVNEIRIDSAIENIKEYEIYDVTGRTLVTIKGLNINQTTINAIAKNNQALLVKVALNNGQVVSKKVLF